MKSFDSLPRDVSRPNLDQGVKRTAGDSEASLAEA